MSPQHRAVAAVLLLSAGARATELDWPAPPRTADAAPRFSLTLSNRTGLAQAPFVTTAFPEVSGFATVTTPTAAVQLASIGWLHAKLPISYVRLDFPARAQVGEATIGNFELGLGRRFQLQPSTGLLLVAALLAPSANDGPETSLLENRGLALSSALSGNKDAFLLTPGVAGLRLGASVEHTLRALQFRARLDVPILVRVSDASLPEETETHAVGLAPALGVSAAWWATSWFGASLGASLITEAVRVQEPTRAKDRAQRLQPVVEPSLHFQLGQHVKLALDGSIPLAGTLAGEAWSVGTSAQCEL